MKKGILILTGLATLSLSAFAANDTNCSTPLLKRDFNVTVQKEYQGVSAQELFDQSEHVKQVKPVLIKEIKKYTKMLKASDEAYSGVTTVDRIINEVCELKTPLWEAMSANQKTLMLGIDGTPNPYMRKSAHNADVKALKEKLSATKKALAKAKAEITVAYKTADQRVIDEANRKISALKLRHAADVAKLNKELEQQANTLNDLTKSPHAIGVYNTAKFHGFKTIDFGNGDVAICSTGVKLLTAEKVNLEAVCIADAGHYKGHDTVRIYEGYSTDDTNDIDFVRLPYVIKTSNVDTRLRYYNAPASVRKGLRNGPDYQSAILYSGGRVITNDPQSYYHSPVVHHKAKTKKPLKVQIINTDKDPVVVKTVKDEENSSHWWE